MDGSHCKHDQLSEGGNSSTPPFAAHASPDPVQIALEAQRRLTAIFEAAKASGDVAVLLEMRKALKEMTANTAAATTDVDAALLGSDLQKMRRLFASLSDPDAPTIGADYLKQFDATQCTIAIDPDLLDEKGALTAQYISYAHGKTVKGFINKIGINKYKLGNFLALTDSTNHESWHALQKDNAEALHLSPFNPATRAIIHPLDWIQLENLCERDAYAKEGLFNYLISQQYPEARARSRFDLVSVDDFERAKNDWPPLHNAVIHCALNALYKSKIENDDSELFVDHYVGVAIRNYRAGMEMRTNAGEKGHTFIRLEDDDFWQVGNYGVGPNSLGRYRIDPGFRIRPRLSEEQQKDLNAICRKYNIPPIEKCKTLAEYQGHGVPAPVESQPARDTSYAGFQPAFG